MATQVMRPQTSPNSRMLCRSRATSRGASRGGSRGGGEESQAGGEYQIELLEYEWPDLPPIPNMKDAIARSRVSNGISYLLPVDKGRNSINNRYRTDLRAMFQEPYASDSMNYDDSKVSLSAKVHFISNHVDTRWTQKHESQVPTSLNSDSEIIRGQFARSAPSGAAASRRMGLDPSKRRKRSNLFLPIKAQIPPEAIKLREEVKRIFKSVQEDDEEFDEDQMRDVPPLTESEVESRPDASESSPLDRRKTAPSTLRQPSSAALSQSQCSVMSRLVAMRATPETFETYEELKKAKPPKPIIPEALRSRYLPPEKSQEIWEWLHFGEQMSDFEYFLSVCG